MTIVWFHTQEMAKNAAIPSGYCVCRDIPCEWIGMFLEMCKYIFSMENVNEIASCIANTRIIRTRKFKIHGFIPSPCCVMWFQ